MNLEPTRRNVAFKFKDSDRPSRQILTEGDTHTLNEDSQSFISNPNHYSRFQPTSPSYQHQQAHALPRRAIKSPNISFQANSLHHSIIDQKEQENQSLRDELSKMKTRADHINNMKPYANVSLDNMALNMNGMHSNPPPSRKEFFLQNEIRDVDLTEEERMLLNMNAQDADALKTLSHLPIGTELYRFKTEQYKELCMVRGEVEKVVQEQRLARLQRKFETKRRDEDRTYDQQRFVDDWRKQIVSARLRKDLNQSRGERLYDPVEGFVIRWDYILGIPKRADTIRALYGIYVNGEEAYAPRLIEKHGCETDTAATNRCIIGESHHLTDVPANSNTLLIFELQTSEPGIMSHERAVSYAWSQLDLFDARRQLKYA